VKEFTNKGSPVLELRGVSCRRPGAPAPAISGVTLRVERGEWLCLAGRNGSGKSTLIRLMAGLLSPSEGDIFVGGERFAGEDGDRLRSRIGVLFSEPDDQFIGQTVADDIAFGLENLCLSREEMDGRIDRVAGMLGIGRLLGRHPSTLSGGQKQLAALAAVLAMEPDILLLDEPGSMLDDRSREMLRSAVARLHATGRYTIVQATHDPEDMLAAGRLAMMSGGRLLAVGRPEALLADEKLAAECRLETPFVLAFCREMARLGFGIGDHLDERKAVEALWAYASRTS
jgi:energy-coupling factor transport system ATP-binding protein